MRTVKTTSGATAVQVVWSSRRGSREIEHLGSAHDEAELEALKAAAQQRIAAGQLELGLGLEPAGGGPLPINSSRIGYLLDALEQGYRVLGLEDEMRTAVGLLARQARLIAEPGGAAAVAAWLFGAAELPAASTRWPCSPAATSTRCC